MVGGQLIPRPSAAAVDRDGRLTREWYAYLQALVAGEQSQGGDLSARVEALAREIEGLLHPFQITPAPGIVVQGAPEGGLVRIGIADSGVTPGTYANPELTVGADGRVTDAQPAPAGDLIAGPNVTLTGDLSGRLVGAGDVTVEAAGIPEAPMDGKQYARQSGTWSEVVASGGGTPGDVVELASDFLSQPATSNTGADFFTNSTTGVVEHLTLPESPGVMRLRPPGTTTTQANILSRSASFLFGGGEIIFEALAWIDYAPGSLIGQIFRVGLWDTESSGANWGVRFILSPSSAYSTGWYATVVDGGTDYTIGRHEQPVEVGRKYKLRLLVAADGGSVEAFIDGVSIGSRAISNPNDHAAMRVRAQMWSITGGTNSSSQGHYVDYLRARKTLSTPR